MICTTVIAEPPVYQEESRGEESVYAQRHVNKPSVMIGSDEADAWFAAVGPMERPLG
jgi:hypothetical protein